jgi:hypothetical protein
VRARNPTLDKHHAPTESEHSDLPFIALRISNEEVSNMGRGILLWLLGVPIPIILLLAWCSHH